MSKKSLVSIQRLESYEPLEVQRAVGAVLEPLGGMGAFVGGDRDVLLKPNLLMPKRPEQAVCTHPEIIRAVARLAADCGAPKVELTDSPGFGTATKCTQKLGLGGDEPFVVVDADDGVDVAPPEGAEIAFHKLIMSKRMLEAPVLINLPKAKTHGQMVMTAAVKNMYGAVVGLEKIQWHYRAGKDPRKFAKLLLHIYDLAKPTLNILDAVIAMEGNGPGAGEPRPLGLIMASTNAHALDAVLARVMGLTTDKVYTLAAAKEAGLLPDETQIEIVGAKVEDLIPSPPWKLAQPVSSRGMGGPKWLSGLLDRVFCLQPKTDQKKCTACGRCKEACAAKAITIDKKRQHRGQAMIIDYDLCISCFCCQEICPEGAIRVARGFGSRLLRVGR